MSAVASALLRLYPRAWRNRYGDEMQALLAVEKLSLRTATDLLAGAIDARINPQLRRPASAELHEGARTMVKTTVCNPAGLTVQDQRRSAAWMVGGSLVLVAIATLLKLQIGTNALSEGLLYAAFPASMMLSMECTYLKRYSRASRLTISLGGALLIVLMMWASTAVANRI